MPTPTVTFTITTTYLEIASRERFKPYLEIPADVQILESREPLPDFYRFLYRSVGHEYYWFTRLKWTDQMLREYLCRPVVSLLVLYLRGTPIGYVELNAESEEFGTEVAYFGLISAYHGRGYGKYLLSVGVQHAYEQGAQRVWVHTSTLDGPYALANYKARGFAPYKTETHQETHEVRMASND
jgi:GNAT superfamily N-acetyltransferase